MTTSRYFELLDEHGRAPAYTRQPDGTEVENPNFNEPEPINEVGVTVAIPTIVAGELVPLAQTLVIRQSPQLSDDLHARVVPGTRVIEVGPTGIIAADALVASGQYREVDPPKHLRKQPARDPHTKDAGEPGKEA